MGSIYVTGLSYLGHGIFEDASSGRFSINRVPGYDYSVSGYYLAGHTAPQVRLGKTLPERCSHMTTRDLNACTHAYPGRWVPHAEHLCQSFVVHRC